jgi:hypothetical protein
MTTSSSLDHASIHVLHRHAPRVVPPATAAYRVSAALGLVGAAAAAATFFVPHVLKGPAAMNGSARGTALVVMALAVPLLLGAMVATARGSARAPLVWAGSVAYLLYNSVLFLFATPFNRLFLLYIAMLGLSLWSVITVLAELDRRRLVAAASPTFPVRPLAVYAWVIAALNGAVWLRQVVPTVISGRRASFLDGTGLTVNPVHVQDLAMWLPVMVVGAWWLWHHRAWGLALVGAMLVMWTLESVGVATDQWFGHRADQASSVASLGGVALFAALAVINVLPLVVFFRHLDARHTGHRGQADGRRPAGRGTGGDAPGGAGRAARGA